MELKQLTVLPSFSSCFLCGFLADLMFPSSKEKASAKNLHHFRGLKSKKNPTANVIILTGKLHNSSPVADQFQATFFPPKSAVNIWQRFWHNSTRHTTIESRIWVQTEPYWGTRYLSFVSNNFACTCGSLGPN